MEAQKGTVNAHVNVKDDDDDDDDDNDDDDGIAVLDPLEVNTLFGAPASAATDTTSTYLNLHWRQNRTRGYPESSMIAAHASTMH
jgi:hypothetical protein